MRVLSTAQHSLIQLRTPLIVGVALVTGATVIALIWLRSRRMQPLVLNMRTFEDVIQVEETAKLAKVRRNLIESEWEAAKHGDLQELYQEANASPQLLLRIIGFHSTDLSSRNRNAKQHFAQHLRALSPEVARCLISSAKWWSLVEDYPELVAQHIRADVVDTLSSKGISQSEGRAWNKLLSKLEIAKALISSVVMQS